MAINFTDSPSNGATQTISGRTYTYNSAKNKWDTTATEVAGPTATVYANVAALPTSGNITGNQAFVSATNRLYIWNGTGWYNIALINTNPTISGVASSYALAIDGTATTVTITASDPEGLPITYSIASDTSGNSATVAQGTGSNTNVFTITPSTNNAHAGTFSLTFRASDGVNLATAVSSFTLQFKVVNQKYTTALITSVGANNAVNTSFDDKSTSNHTITANGDAHQTTFSPYRHGGYSTYFDGTGDYLTTPASTDFYLDGEFTWECWVNCGPSYFRQRQRLLTPAVSSATGSAYISIGNDLGINGGAQSGVLCCTYSVSVNPFLYANVNGTNTGTAVTVPLNQWCHLAITRDSNNDVKMWQDGVLVASGSYSGAFDFNRSVGARVGGSGWSTEDFGGHMTEVRIVKGTAVYTSAFTPPTERLTAITNTSLLACHLPYIADGSTNSHAITINGNTKTLPFAPYDAQEYAAADHGGSAHFDGTGDSISAASSADLGFGTGDFSIEWWTYFNAISNYPYQIDMRSADNDTGLAFFTRTNLGNELGVYVSASIIASGAKSFKPGIWTHYAICKTGGYLKGYMNGVQDFSIACTRDYGSSKAIRIGAVYGNGNYFVDGNIADFRVVKGTAVYTAEFTPPTAPLTAVTNTKLLVQSTDAGIIDKSQTAEKVQLFADTKSSTAQYKFLSSSIYFDGTGDYLKTPSSGNFLAEGPWTQEMWLRLAGTAAGQQIGPAFGGGAGAWNSSNGHQWLLFTHGSGFLVQYYGTNNSHNTITIASSAPFTANTWHHWAISWDGTTLRFFMDGTSVHTTTSFSPNTMTATHTELGRMPDNSYYSQAYYSDVRITKGLARYTANFTPSTAALPG